MGPNDVWAESGVDGVMRQLLEKQGVTDVKKRRDGEYWVLEILMESAVGVRTDYEWRVRAAEEPTHG